MGIAEGFSRGKLTDGDPLERPVISPQIPSNFWQEFIRVQFDKLLLLALIIFCWRTGLTDDMRYAVGALLYALQSNRFRWN